MLTFVNEGLFSYAPKTEKNIQNGKDILQLAVATSNYLVTYAKGSKMDKYNRNQDAIQINRQHDIDMRDNPAIEPINREIFTVNYISEDQLKDVHLLNTQPTSLKVTENQRGVPTVSVRCLKNDAPNKSDLYAIAFPFNGMILPLPEDPRYRIYKGVIMSSVRPFYYNNRRYRKILYLVIEPHTALFNPDHKYHTDVINLTLESFAIYKDRETGEDRTNHETFTLNMRDNQVMDYQWNYETMNEARRIEPDPNTPLWVTFKFKPKTPQDQHNNGDRTNHYHDNDDHECSQRNDRRRNFSNGQKAGHVEGNTYVTTNRHGIRKEVPIHNSNRNYRQPNYDDNLERMMQESGMYDDDYSPRNNRNNRGNKRGNKRKHNHSDDYWN